MAWRSFFLGAIRIREAREILIPRPHYIESVSSGTSSREKLNGETDKAQCSEIALLEGNIDHRGQRKPMGPLSLNLQPRVHRTRGSEKLNGTE